MVASNFVKWLTVATGGHTIQVIAIMMTAEIKCLSFSTFVTNNIFNY